MEDNENDLNIPNFGIKSGNHYIKTEPKPNDASRVVSSPKPILPSHSDMDFASDKKSEKPGKSSNKVRTRKPVAKQDSRWRLFFGLSLFVVTFIATLWILNNSQKGIEVIIAVREILPGQAITNGDLSTAKVSVSPELAANLYSPNELSNLINSDTSSNTNQKVASRLIRAHEPIMSGDIVAQATLNKTGVPEGMVALSLPVSASTAAARINRNDLVTLLYFDKDDKEQQTAVQSQVLAERVKVLDVTRSPSGFSLNSSSSSASNSGSVSNPLADNLRSPLTNLTLLVTLDQAKTIASAKEKGVVNVVLLPGFGT